MALVLTSIYLEEVQRNALEQLAKKNHSNLSEEVRNAIDLYNSGISLNELEMLDTTSQQAKSDIDEMNAILDAGLIRAKIFFTEIAKLKAAQ